ncbi:MAG: enoyl-CoA hydratase-related protein [Dehalococcoidia bacterium]|nr:enoyl-CoA hydratase-related protein [Dehalococcoidia bacterium]
MSTRDLLRDQYGVLPPEFASASFLDLREELERLRDSPARLVVFELEGEGAAQRWDAEQLLWLERYPLPAVAVLRGEVSGHALDLALACDIRVAADDATLRLRTIGTRRMMLLLGLDRSVEVLRRRGQLDAETALRIGLVSRLAPPGELDEMAARLAGTIASRGPIAVQLAKEAIWRGLTQPLEQALRFETDLTLLLQTTKDRAEGVAAFLEKRPPEFTGA